MLVVLDLTKLRVQEKTVLKKLGRWMTIAEAAKWTSIMEGKDTFASVSGAARDNATIFNVGENDHRLITYIDYKTQIIIVADLLTQAEYDKWNEGK